jgi:hypothetical protein
LALGTRQPPFARQPQREQLARVAAHVLGAADRGLSLLTIVHFYASSQLF